MDSGVEVQQLRARHNELEKEIETEIARPSPDSAHMASLKKQKLRKQQLRKQQLRRQQQKKTISSL